MSLTPEQYIALSTLVYESTSKNDIKAPIGNIISRIENRNKLEYAALSSLSSYILLDYISTLPLASKLQPFNLLLGR